MPPSTSTSTSDTKRKRSPIACEKCHSRRVRCDVSRSHPCTNCQEGGHMCRLISSRRGKYDRNTSRNAQRSSNEISETNPLAREIEFPPPDELRNMSQLQAAVMSNAIDAGSPPADSPSRNDTLVEHIPVNSAPDHHSPADEAALLLIQRRKLSNLSHLDSKYLIDSGLFTLPSKEALDNLIWTYFAYVHCAYPVVDRQEFAKRYNDPKEPPSFLLLYAMLFMASMHADEFTLYSAGFSSRREACYIFYKRAKMIHDFSLEKDRIVTVQALFLISFWWDGPRQMQNTWYWLGAAVYIAKSVGAHRSKPYQLLDLQQRRHWRRLWWSLLARDRISSAAMGHPPHIDGRFSDIEPLAKDDFVPDATCCGEIFGMQKEVHVDYVVSFCALSRILENINLETLSIKKESGPRTESLAHLETSLHEWEASLPETLKFEMTNSTSEDGTWACLLHIAYNYCLILVLRSNWKVTKTDRTAYGQDCSLEAERKSLAAAIRITLLAEKLLMQKKLQYSQLHLVPALYTAMIVHAFTRHLKDAGIELANLRLRICMLTLNDLKAYWPVAGWVLRLFQELVSRAKRDSQHDRRTARTSIVQPSLLSLAGNTESSQSDTRYNDVGDSVNPVLNMIEDDLWPYTQLPLLLKTNSPDANMEFNEMMFDASGMADIFHIF